MRDAARLLVTALAITGFALGAGLLVTLGFGGHDGGSGAGPRAGAPASTISTMPAEATAPPLSEVDTTELAVRRAAFCSAVPAALVSATLGRAPTSSASYADGQRGALTPNLTDVSHEFDCSWSAGPRTARAWIFAPPITPDQAAALVTDVARTDGCDRIRGAATYGDPGVAVRCRTSRGPVVSFRGLFGDAWLACSLSGATSGTTSGTAGGTQSDAALVDQAGRWCGAVAEAAAGP